MKYRIIILLTALLITGGTAMAQSQAQAQDSAITIRNWRDSGAILETAPLLTIPRRLSTASISTAGGDDLFKTPTTNTANTLIGRLSGVYVKQSTDEPLGVPAMVSATNMTIRGLGSYGFVGNNGFNTFRVYIDGFESTLNYFTTIPAEDIESVSVLKDAAAVATFGMKGDNGILWVTTKQGHAGKSHVEVRARTGVQQALNIDKPLGSYDYARLYNEAISNDNGNQWTPAYSDAQLQAYKNGTGTNVDWYNQGIKHSAFYTGDNVSFSGGSNGARYYLNFDYLDQQGLFNVQNTDSTSNEKLQRYNLSSNLDLHISKVFSANISLRGMVENQKAPNYSTTTLWNNMAAYPSNIYPVKQDSGRWSGTALYPNNPIASENALGWVSTQYRILQGNFRLKEDLSFVVPGLYASEAFSFYSYASTTYSKTADYARYYDSATTTTDQQISLKAQPQTSAGQEDLKQARLTLGYDHTFSDSRLTTAVDYYGSDYLGDGFSYYATNYQNLSGRVNYAWQEKYIGEVGFSYFGSDAYAPGHRWGFYPAVSAAWIVSKEKFLEKNTSIDLLKLRLSAGRSGGMNDNVSQSGRYLYQQYYQTSALSGGSFYTNNPPTLATILAPLYTANPNVFAEKSMKYNVGVDLGLLHKLNLSLDAFLDKRSGILTQDHSIPDYYGYNLVYNNVGRVTNKGAEVMSTWSDKIGAFSYSLSGMISYNRNRIDYMAETPPPYAYNAQTGRSIGVPIGLVATGYYQLNDFNADGSLKQGEPVPQFGAVQPGDIKYKDLNGDGKIDLTDVTAIGKSPFPQWVYSFGATVGYKGFDLSAFFDGALGVDVNLLAAAPTQSESLVNNGNAFAMAKNAWAYYPQEGIDTRATATYPRLSTTANTNNYQYSTYWMKSGDFMRLHNLELGYTTLLKKGGASTVRFYLNAINVATWSTLLKHYQLDPETLGGYPAVKSYNAGVTLSF
jgi:TonB-linked SusC/RagA family outer membrane protein